MDSPSNPKLNIAAVERETGLSKDVLRKWETRYGFPAPLRDSQGERAYPEQQVDRLRQIKRLMDTGMRPARLVGLDAAGLAALAQASPPTYPRENETEAQTLTLDILCRHNPDGFRQCLYRECLRQGVESFVLDTLAHLNLAVGEAWARGDLGIHEEHAYTEAVQWLLRDAIASLSEAGGRPRVLLTTLPDEQHGLGVLMVATLFSLHGAHCISLGTQTPVRSIVQAARAHGADVVALSFSSAYPRRSILPALAELGQGLATGAEIWAGGAGTARLRATSAAIRLLPGMEQALAALADWRAAHPDLSA